MTDAGSSFIPGNEKRLATFFAGAPDAVIVINEQQEILDWNPKAEHIFGFTAQEVKGLHLSDTIIPLQYREAHVRGMQHFLATGIGPVLNKTVEITALRKSGEEFYVNLSISNVKMDGEWIFIAFVSDISERKRMEERLIRKEAELLQSKLIEEQKDAFISIASHELKTPLTTIKAYTQLALSHQEGCSDSLKSFLLKIDQYTGKLTHLLNELLDVSRIHTGNLNLASSKLDLKIFLEEVVASIQFITPKHQIIIEKNEHATVNIDILRMEQVITNLISNAAKYSPGRDKIIFRTGIIDGFVKVSCTDHGIGINDENLTKVFNRYYRVESSATEFGGLGIGLYISMEIIIQHGGEMWVESEPGKGSTFFFTLPLV